MRLSNKHIACGESARVGVQNTYHWAGHIGDVTAEWLPQWWRDPAGPTSQSLFHFNYIQIWQIWRPQL